MREEKVLIKSGTPVIAKWGFNYLTEQPFEYLFKFGYTNHYGDVVIYNKGTGEAHIFKKDEIRIASDEDLKIFSWAA